jgi:spore maturation protein CgeB
MKILFLDSPAFAKQDMIDAFTEQHLQCDLFFHKDYTERQSTDFSAAFDAAVSQDCYDFVFSFNYFPVLSNCCKRHNIRYVSYVYDSPLVALYSCTLINSCNYVFLFDKATYLTFKNAGISTVYYLPLAANTKRLASLVCPKNLLPTISSDVSFIGSLYNEEHNLFDRLNGITDYTRGYLTSIMAAQQKVYGQFFLEELLSEDILADLQNACPYEPLPDGTESASYVYANYFLCRKITSNERIALLRAASERFPLKLFTHQPAPELPHASYVGPVDYYDTMPLVFQHSRINLNITLKSIHTGIPLRCMDIMGSGGFLLSNYQEDFLDCFVPGEDFVFYESEDDFIQKIDYYLSHDAERRQIAANGAEKMRESHTFSHRVRTILAILS